MTILEISRELRRRETEAERKAERTTAPALASDAYGQALAYGLAAAMLERHLEYSAPAKAKL